MAEIREIGEKGKRTGQRVGKSASQRVGKMATRRAGKAAGLAESNATKPRKRRVKGYGVDRLRRAAERRMAEGSEALAQALWENAIKGEARKREDPDEAGGGREGAERRGERGRCAGACRFAGWLGGEGWADVGWA
jgi:hypothetical protein